MESMKCVGGKEDATKSLTVHGAFALAQKIERKKMSVRDENRHLDVKAGKSTSECRELIERYRTQYGDKKTFRRQGEKHPRQLSNLKWAGCSSGKLTGSLWGDWYSNLTTVRDLSPGTGRYDTSTSCTT